jgi:acylphosphatase
MENKIRVHAIITGKVQGVFFRMETQRAARNYGVTGWVRNKMDGSVDAVMEGNEADVKSLLAWCQEGPPHARVSNVDVIWQDYTGEFETFEVTY